MDNIRIIIKVEIIDDLHNVLKLYTVHNGLYFDDSNKVENELYKIINCKKMDYYTFDIYITNNYFLYEILLSYWENEEVKAHDIIIGVENKIKKSEATEIDIHMNYSYNSVIALSSNVHAVPYSIMQELINEIELEKVLIHESHGNYGADSFFVNILLSITAKIVKVALPKILNILNEKYGNYPELSTLIIKSFDFSKLYKNIRNYGEINIKEMFPIKMSIYNKDKYHFYFRNKDALIEIICDKNSNILKLERK